MTTTEWALILGMAIITFGIRYSILAFANQIDLSSILKEALQYIAPAVLTAIAVPAVLMPTGEMDLSLANPYLVSAGFAILAGVLTKKVMGTILVGLAAFFLYQIIF